MNTRLTAPSHLPPTCFSSDPAQSSSPSNTASENVALDFTETQKYVFLDFTETQKIVVSNFTDKNFLVFVDISNHIDNMTEEYSNVRYIPTW